jgi:hypothetical protein
MAHKNVFMALAAAQSEMGAAKKSAANPHFKSKYADLAEVVEAVKPALTKNGLCFYHTIEVSDFGRYMVTVLAHGESETEIRCPVELIIGKADMQGFKSATTYAKRIGLESVTGIAPEDDDGNAAAASVKHNPATEGLADAWRDSVLDKLPANATDAEKAEAFADAICDEFKGKKQKALDNAWQRRAKLIESLERRYPEYHSRVVHAYEQQQELNSMETAAE